MTVKKLKRKEKKEKKKEEKRKQSRFIERHARNERETKRCSLSERKKGGKTVERRRGHRTRAPFAGRAKSRGRRVRGGEQVEDGRV